MTLKARFMHALVVTARSFGAWLAAQHVLLSIGFGKSVLVAAVGAGVEGGVDFLTHVGAGG